MSLLEKTNSSNNVNWSFLYTLLNCKTKSERDEARHAAQKNHIAFGASAILNNAKQTKNVWFAKYLQEKSKLKEKYPDTFETFEQKIVANLK